MSDIRVTTFLQSLLVLVLLGLSLPAFALEPISKFTTHNLSVFFSGLLYGSFGILSLYNLSLFFTQRCKSSFAFLAYVCCIFVWLYTIAIPNMVQDPNSADTIVLSDIAPELILLIPFSVGLFLLAFTEQTLKRITPSNMPYLLIMSLLLIVGLYLSYADPNPSVQNNLIISLLGLSSFTFGLICFKQIKTPSSPAIFCFLGCIIPFFFTLYLAIQQFFTPEIPSFITASTEFIFLLQAILFTFALNYQSKQFLIDEIHAMTDDLHANIEQMNTQNEVLNIARKEALKASNIKSRFLANISHEIRTPLNAILGFSQELKTTSNNQDRAEQINLINLAAKNLHALVNDVLDLSKIEAGKFKITAQEYQPLEFFEELVELNAKSAQMKQLEFNFYHDNLPQKLQGDCIRLKQVITNLLSNALKFTQSGHISLSVVSKNLQNEMVELTIKVDDTGHGISEKNTKKLFSAFSQVDADINLESLGCGLGLAISRDIIKMMKGTINVVSEERIGTSFVVKVQQKIIDNKDIYAAQSTFTHKRALLIDPKPESRRNTAALLKQAGMITTCAESREFLTLLSNNKALPAFDFCFVSLPQDKSIERNACLQQLEHLKLKKIIILYSGAKPLEQYERFNSKVSKQIALPLTLSKLLSLSNAKQRNSLNPIQQKLQQLPELSVLAVDDVPINLKLLATFLKNSKINLTTVESGPAAIEQCKAIEFDLILMDIQMPSMDGIQTTQHIRKIALNMGTPVIALTAHAFNDEKEQFLASGFDDFLPKPIDLESLITLIELWCHIPEHSALSAPKVVSLDITSMLTLDWQLAVKRANYNEDAARELLDEFVVMLPTIIQDIQANHKTAKINSIHADVHKLHGACCYTGVPRLQRLCFEIESQFKTNQLDGLDQNLDALADEATRVMHDVQAWLARSTN